MDLWQYPEILSLKPIDTPDEMFQGEDTGHMYPPTTIMLSSFELHGFTSGKNAPRSDRYDDDATLSDRCTPSPSNFH